MPSERADTIQGVAETAGYDKTAETEEAAAATATATGGSDSREWL